MSTRYENSDGIDSAISFEEQVISPPEEELLTLLKYIIYNNKKIDTELKQSDINLSGRELYKQRLLYIMDNNKNVSLPLQGRVTINRLRKEK